MEMFDHEAMIDYLVSHVEYVKLEAPVYKRPRCMRERHSEMKKFAPRPPSNPHDCPQSGSKSGRNLPTMDRLRPDCHTDRPALLHIVGASLLLSCDA